MAALATKRVCDNLYEALRSIIEWDDFVRKGKPGVPFDLWREADFALIDYERVNAARNRDC